MSHSDEGTQERLRSALVRGLVERGCPAGRARELAADALHGWWSVFPVSGRDDVQGWLEWRGMSLGLDDPDDPDDVASAVEDAVENLAAENAEAWDRGARGETYDPPLWPLPHRRPCR